MPSRQVLRRCFPLAIVAIVFAMQADIAVAAEETPNVLIILTDDQGYEDVGAYGSTYIDTPNIDRIANSGVRFTQFYAGAAYCSPSRASLLTGRTAERAGVTSNTRIGGNSKAALELEQVTIAEKLSAYGYRTAAIGKWHLSASMDTTPIYQGFDYFFGHLSGVIDNYSHFNYWGMKGRHDLYQGTQRVHRPGRYFADMMVEETLAFIDQESSAPFFVYFALNSPHYPYQGDPEWLQTYDERGLVEPEREYAAFVSSMDARIGSLLDGLQERGILDNTIIVFQSDHGHSTESAAYDGGGSAGIFRGAKFSFFEGGIRVPAIISWPDMLEHGEVRDQFAVSADWFPTILDLIGVSYEGLSLDGKSLHAVLQDASAPAPRSEYIWYWFHPRVMDEPKWAIRQQDWKLLVNAYDTSTVDGAKPLRETLDGLFLVNLADDPAEQRSVHEDHPDVVTRLMKLKDDYETELRDLGVIEHP